MKKIILLLTIIGLGNILSINAQKITENEARQKAVSFFKQGNRVKSISGGQSACNLTLAYTCLLYTSDAADEL